MQQVHKVVQEHRERLVTRELKELQDQREPQVPKEPQDI